MASAAMGEQGMNLDQPYLGYLLTLLPRVFSFSRTMEGAKFWNQVDGVLMDMRFASSVLYRFR